MADPLRICLIDMNAGVPNEAMRCFRRLEDEFLAAVRAANPRIESVLSHVQPRNRGELPPPADLYLSTGGPGSPFDGEGHPWYLGYRDFLDRVTEDAVAQGDRAPGLLVICYSYELAIEHFGVAKMTRRGSTKFGVMPVYPTEAGRRSPLLRRFGDRFFAWEHRDWQSVDLDPKKLAELGGELLAQESRDGVSKGEGLLAFRFAPGILGTQFHPEADIEGARAWFDRDESKEALIKAYGELLYARMQRSLLDPGRIERTFKTLIPGWLAHEFNRLAPHRGWNPVEAVDVALPPAPPSLVP